MERVVTPDLVARAHARRKHPEAPVEVRDGVVAFEEVRVRWHTSRHHWVRGLEEPEGDHGHLMRRADAILTAEYLPATLDIDACAAAECMLMGSGSLVWAIAGHTNARDALLVKLYSHRYRANTKTKQGVGWWWELAGGPTAIAIEPFAPLRAAICASSDEDYAVARDEAARLRSETTRRTLIDFCFPSEPEWANEDLAATLASPNFAQLERTAAGLLASTTDRALAQQFIERATVWTVIPYACDLVLGFEPDDAWTLLECMFRRVRDSGVRHRPFQGPLSRAVAALEGEEPARLFAPLLLERGVGPVAAAYFRRWKELAFAVLPSFAAQKNTTADVAARILYGHRATHDDVRASPAFLADPPWRKLPSRTELALAPLDHEAKVVLSESERQQTLEIAQTIPMTEDILKEWEALSPQQRCVDAFAKWSAGTWKVWTVPPEIGLSLWNEKPEMRTYYPHVTMLARHGDAAIPGLLARGQLDAMVHVDSPVVAPACAHALLRKRMSRRMGRAWLLAHPETAAIGLLPNALGAEGRKQREAEIALLFLAHHGHRALVENVAARFGAEAYAVMRARLDRDPRAEIDAKPSSSAWAWPELPRPRLADGTMLGEEAFQNLLELLRGCSPVVPYAGFEELRALFDPDSLAELARALFEIWLLAPGSEAQSWMAWSLVGLGNTASTRAFLHWVRERGQRSDSRSDLLLRMLSAIGTPPALLELALMARDAPLASVQTEADLVLDEVATSRGLTRAQLEDRIVPTLDLDTKPAIDLGSRQFRIVLDDRLVPCAVGEDGRRLAQLPRPSERDDPELARAAAERWREMSASLETIHRLVVPRLERAMIRGHRWSAPDFLRYVARHPVVAAIARRLVWSTGMLTFRIVEDGTLADETDSLVTIDDPSAEIFLPHAFDLTEEGKAIWGQVFADYGILQPFDQLGRATHVLPKGELSANRSKRIAGTVLEPHKLLRIAHAHGWKRPPPTATITQLWRSVRAVKGKELRVWIQVQPGFWLWKIEKDQTLGDLIVVGGTFADIHPMELSELLRDLDAFT